MYACHPGSPVSTKNMLLLTSWINYFKLCVHGVLSSVFPPHIQFSYDRLQICHHHGQAKALPDDGDQHGGGFLDSD